MEDRQNTSIKITVINPGERGMCAVLKYCLERNEIKQRRMLLKMVEECKPK